MPVPIVRTWAWLAAILFLLSACTSPGRSAVESDFPDAPQNFIFFIADGCGPASFTMARDFLDALGRSSTLPIDSILTGSVRTHSANSRVTDSAAAGTALACGIKTNNGVIGMDLHGNAVLSALDHAMARGMATGLVTTTTITHATPASFSANVPDRNDEAAIAVQQVDREIDVLLGGGLQFFVPEAAGGARSDGRDLVSLARERGAVFVDHVDDLRTVNELPLLGLFADSHLPFEIDRDVERTPSLAEMTAHAIRLLRANANGFFLMVEGGRIDHAAHDNDAAAHVHDVLAYLEAMDEALRFARADGNTLVIATSDHETGGLSLGRNVYDHAVYDWRPEVLLEVNQSLDRFRANLASRPVSSTLRSYVSASVLDASGVARYDELISNSAATSSAQSPGSIRDELAEIVSRSAVVGWTTGGHTAVDVNLYAYGPGSELFRGHYDNTHVGQTLARLIVGK